MLSKFQEKMELIAFSQPIAIEKWFADACVSSFIYPSIYSLVFTIWVVTIALPEIIKYFLENASICIPTIYDDEYFL